MDDKNTKPVISDVARPRPANTEPQPQNVQKTEEPVAEAKQQVGPTAVKDRSNLKLAVTIILALVVAGVLIGAAYTAFMQDEDNIPTETDNRALDTQPTDSMNNLNPSI